MPANQAKPTPGPWIATQSGRGEYIVIGDEPFTKRVATMGNFDLSREMQEANAEFIVRACNSHAVLVEALRYATTLLPDGPTRNQCYDAISLAEKGHQP